LNGTPLERFKEGAHHGGRKYMDASRLAISPQCGFASTMGGNRVTEADEREAPVVRGRGTADLGRLSGGRPPIQ
jgi:hypothetical protein